MKRYLKWVHEDVQLLSESAEIHWICLLRQVELFRKSLLEITRLVRTLSRNGRYGEAYENIVSIPGIGMITGMCLLTEIGDIHRFRNKDNSPPIWDWYLQAIAAVKRQVTAR